MPGWSVTAYFPVLIGFAVKSTVVLSAAWIIALLLRTRSAAARHLVWTAAAAAILALPLLSVVLPSIRVPAPAVLAPESTLLVVSAGVPDAARNANSRPAALSPANSSRPTIARDVDWRLWVVASWAGGVIVLLMAWLAAWCTIRRLHRSALAFADRDLVAALSQQLGIRHAVEVREAPAGTMPLTGGVLHPFVLIPSDAMEWSDECRRMVLVHELAHVRRGDTATHLLARAALMLCWWNPLAWKAWREFVKEREQAADDMVLNAGAAASEYASGLLNIARSMKQRITPGWAAVTMARRSQLEGRLLAILDSGVNRRAATRASAIAAGLLAVAVVLPLAAVQAQNGAEDTAAQAIPANIETFIRSAVAQKNAAILESAAQSAAELRKYDAAQELMEAAATIESEVSGPQSAGYGLALLRLGDLQEKQGDRDSAVVLYSRAAEILTGRREAARALIYLGADAIRKKDYDKAIADFQRAQTVDPAQSGAALMWMAVAREQDHQTDQATSLYQRALAEQDPNSREAVTTMMLYQQFLRSEGRDAEANDINNRIAAAEKTIAGQVRSQPSASAAVVYTASSPGVERPVLVKKTDPSYTDEARAAKLQGTEVLEIEIGPDGLVHNPRVITGPGLGLDEAGIDAVTQWRFKPGMKDGQPVPVRATVEMNWRLM